MACCATPLVLATEYRTGHNNQGLATCASMCVCVCVCTSFCVRVRLSLSLASFCVCVSMWERLYTLAYPCVTYDKLCVVAMPRARVRACVCVCVCAHHIP